MKRILLICDEYHWGGHTRALYIKKHLSDTYEFEIVDGKGFEARFDHSNLKFDLLYPLFHMMLNRRDTIDLLQREKRIVTLVTGNRVLRAAFKNQKEYFLKLANKCQAVGANSKIGLKDLRSIYKGKTFYACRGVDPDVFYPTVDFDEEKKFTAAYVGKPVTQKGLEDIIRPACKQAGVKLIANTRIWNDALGEDEMRDFYNEADVYIVASTHDGTPNPALEAASCGLPVISNRIGNMPEFIVDGENGFMIRRSVASYVKKLKFLKANRSLCNEMGQAARATILKNWTWEKVINKNERKLFKEILKDV